jgi:hypothetical protein
MSRAGIQHIENVVPDAYHGTLWEWAQLILKTSFRLSKSPDCHLGSGVYFFESDADRAKDWARKVSRENGFGGKNTAIIKSQVELGRCLDMDNVQHHEILQSVALEICRRQNLKKITDAAVIEFVCTLHPIDTVRAIDNNWNMRQPIFTGSRYVVNNRRLLCVKNVGRIKTKELYEHKKRFGRPGEQFEAGCGCLFS